MEDYKFITVNEMILIDQSNLGYTTANGAAEQINKLLNEKAQKGFTSLNCGSPKTESICDYVGEQFKSDTHEACVFLREIEEEKTGCDCIVQRADEQKFNTEAGFSVSYVPNNFCPKCGDKLK